MPNQIVTIITPYYNDESYLRQAIDSVLSQSYNNFELILVNHASTDSSREIAHSYIDKRIKHIDMPRNEGWSTMLTIKTALEVSTGDYIKILCADDILYSECLEEFIYFFDKNNCDICFSDIEYIDKNGLSLHDTWFNSREYFNINDSQCEMIQKFMMGFSFLPFAGGFLKKTILDDIQINPSYIMVADMSLWLQALIQGKIIKFIEKPLTLYRIHSGQISAIDNEKFAGAASRFEHFSYYNLIYTIHNENKLKTLFSLSRYVNIADFGNKIDREFVISEFLLKNCSDTHRFIASIHIDKMITNDNQRKYLLKKFGFGIKEYRKLYTKQEKDIYHKNYTGIISDIQQKHISELDIKDLSILLLRRIWLKLPIKIRHKIKQQDKKKYSL